MEEKIMSDYPVWYVTPQEFADLIVETMEELHYFKADEFCHPEDIMITFQVVSEALAKGMGYAGKRVWEAEKIKAERSNKAAMMTPKNLKKVLPDDPEYPVQ